MPEQQQTQLVHSDVPPSLQNLKFSEIVADKPCCKQTINEFITQKVEENGKTVGFNWYDNLISKIQNEDDFIISTQGGIKKQAHVELGQRKSKTLLKKEDIVEFYSINDDLNYYSTGNITIYQNCIAKYSIKYDIEKHVLEVYYPLSSFRDNWYAN